MALSDFNIKVTIGAETSQFENGLKKVQTQTTQMSTNFSKFTSGIKKSLLKGGTVGLAIAATTTAIKTLSNTIKQSIKIWEEASVEQKKLAQTLKVTGAEAWTSTEELNAMAEAYQKATNYSSNEVNQMQTVLLGFKNITEDTFQSASDAILDMAEVMGMDLVSATQTVGKALDDPISGLGSLSRQGFKFSETEKELIKNLVEAGDAAKAQKIILDELNTTYGGAAKEGAKATTQLKNNWKSLLQEMGRNIVMSVDIEPAKKKLNELIDHWREIQKEMADVKEYSDNIIKAQKAFEEGTATYEQNLLLVEEEIKQIQYQLIPYQELYQKALEEGWKEEAEYQKQHIDALNREIEPLEYRKKIIEEVIALEKQQAEEQEKANAEIEEQEQKEASIAALKLKYLKLIEEQESLWNLQKTVTGESVDLEEKRTFYQTKLVEIMKEANGQITEGNQYYKDQQDIIASINAEIKAQKIDLDNASKELADMSIWENKILAQKIEQIKLADKDADDYRTREENANKIYLLNLQILKKQEETDLKSVEGTKNSAEAKKKIEEYYANERISLQRDWNEQLANISEEENEEELARRKEALEKTMDMIKKYASGIATAFSNMAKTVTKIFKGIVSASKKLFQFDVDVGLDSLLKFEDNILTFFVDTLHKLPAFFDSAFQSIAVLLQSILQIVTPEKVGEIIIGIVNTITQYGPAIIQSISDILINMLDGLINSMPEILKTLNVIVGKIAEVLPQLIEKLIQAFIAILQNPEEVASLVVALIKGFVEIINVLIRNLAPLLKALLPAIGTIILELIKAIPELLVSMAESIGEALKEIGKYIVNLLIDILNKMLDGISKAWTWTGAKGIPHIKHLATGTQNAQRGLTLVGEAGPELVRFNGGEQVLNNRNTQKALAGMGGNTNNFNVTFNNTQDTTAYAMMSQLRQYNRQMAINGVI